MASASSERPDRSPAIDPHLSALVVHDIKNRLTEQAAMLAALDPQAPDLAQRIDALRALGAHLQHRLIAFLTLYRLEREAGRSAPDDASPARVLRAAASAVPRLRTGVTLREDLADCPPTWVLDAHLVGLAIEAALDNAMRHARHEVVIGAARDGDWLVLRVEDDGPGLDGGAGAPGSPPSPTATGLGTALCRRVAALHHGAAGEGRIALGPRSDGTGTRFELRVPA